MKIYKSNITLLVLFIIGLLIAVNACKKDEQVYPRTRLFQPVLNQPLEAQDNTIIVDMGDMKEAVNYTIEVSRDSFLTTDYTFDVNTNYFIINKDLTGEDLLWYTIYEIRATAHADDSQYDSHTSDLGTIRTDKFPSNQGTPTQFDVLDTRARVFWTPAGQPITGIKVYAISDIRLTTPLKEYDVTDEERAAHQKIVGGLEPNTQYQIAIYSGDVLRGWENYTTREPLVSGDNVIDLTGIDNENVLADTLPALADGSVILLAGGNNYTTGGYEFDKSITIMSGYSFTQALPHIDCSTNFNLANGANIQMIHFKNISFSGDFGGNYIFNISNGGTIGEIKYESCRMHSLRGITRIKGGEGTIDKFTITDCIVDSINGYGVFYVDKDTWSAGDITLENSTFSKCQYFLASRSNSRSVTIESCTICETPDVGRQMFRWRGGDGKNDVTEGIKIYNTIWGFGWDMDNEEIHTVKGFEGLPNTNFDIKNTWATSDFAFASADIPGFPSFTYSGTTTELWTDPLFTIDFSFMDSSFAGKGDSGDPRWRAGL